MFISKFGPKFQIDSAQQVDDQIKAVCAMPKFGLDLMKCELDRLILLTRSSIYPLPYIVPRRAYYDFHADVFPDTYDTQRPGVAKHDWLNGVNGEPFKVALNPESQKRYLTNVLSEIPSTTNNKMTIDVAPKETTPPPETKPSVASLISSMNKANSETPVVTTIKVTNTSKPTITTTAATIPVQSSSSLVINVDNSYTNKENIVIVEVDKKDKMDLDESPMPPPPTATPVVPKPTVVLRKANNQNQVKSRTQSCFKIITKR